MDIILLTKILASLVVIAAGLTPLIFIFKNEKLTQKINTLESEIRSLPTTTSLNTLDSRLLNIETQLSEQQQRTVSPFFYQNLQAPIDHLGKRPMSASKGINNLITEVLLTLPRARDNDKYHSILNDFYQKVFPGQSISDPQKQCEALKKYVETSEDLNTGFLSEFLRRYKTSINLSMLKPGTQFQMSLKRMVEKTEYHTLLADFYKEVFPGEEIPENAFDQKTQLTQALVAGKIDDAAIQEMMTRFKRATLESMESAQSQLYLD